MMVDGQMLRVFIPSLTANSTTCLLLGTKNTELNLCCVTGCAKLCNATKDMLHELFSMRNHDTSVLGLYKNQSEIPNEETLDICDKLLKQLPEWITLTKTDSELPACTLHGKWKSCVPDTNITMVIFSAKDLNASCLLEDLDPRTNLGHLHESWQKGINFLKESRSMCGMNSFVATQRTRFCDVIFAYLVMCCSVATSLLLWICDNRLFHYCNKLPKPAVLMQLLRRTGDLHSAITQHQTSKLNSLRLMNVLWRQSLDIVLGVAVMYFLGCYSKYLASSLMFSAETVASELQSLIQWMMGVPAGLKLNDELAHFLGQFFVYHIYLWTGYLKFLEPLWMDAVWYISLSGCLGLSIQLSLIQDLLSMMTLHSYCFYVYAARLYSLQVSALRSLWRLFRGKKWNPLFERVDSSSYDVDQLFLGTLLFTILLFLLPTTGLFYVVFTGLRLLVLAIQGTLYKIVNLLDALPIYAIYLRVVTSNRVAADVRLHVLPKIPYRPLYHALQLLPVSMTRLFHLLNVPLTPTHDGAYTWGSLIQKIITGKLIYPWIEPTN